MIIQSCSILEQQHNEHSLPNNVKMSTFKFFSNNATENINFLFKLMSLNRDVIIISSYVSCLSQIVYNWNCIIVHVIVCMTLAKLNGYVNWFLDYMWERENIK